jgi:hypothetical protein
MAVVLMAPGAFGQTHPRLVFGSNDVPVLRTKILTEPYTSMYERLLWEKDKGDGFRIVVSPTNVTVPEGGTATFRVKLSYPPLTNLLMHVGIVSTAVNRPDPNITITSPVSLAFTPANWNSFQTVSVAASEDADTVNDSATIRCAIVGHGAADVRATELDNDASYMGTSVSEIQVPETGTATFGVRLSRAPSGNVSVAVSRASGDTSITVSGGASLTFTPANWSVDQTVTLAAGADADAAESAATIRCAASGYPNKDIAAIEDETVGTDRYDLAADAMRYAFLHVLTGDDSYAQVARERVSTVINDPVWANANIKGLSSYMYASRVAYAYDWCYHAPSWDASFRGLVSAKLVSMGDMVAVSGGTEQNTNPASNWQGIRGAAAGLCYLATDHSYSAANYSNMVQKVVRYLQDNLGTNTASRGWNIEGLGYTHYPFGSFIGAFGVALRRNDPLGRDLRTVCEGARWVLWTPYASAVTILDLPYPMHPDFGDDNPHGEGEGAYGLTFWWCPPDLSAGLKWWYDRTVGALGTRTWDSRRAGNIWSILFYPGAEVTGQDPMSSATWRSGFVDTGGNGYFTTRNRYRDKDDIVGQLYVKLRGNKGHSGPDALSFRIFGLNNAWAVGGGRYGPQLLGDDAFHLSMNTLYPYNPSITNFPTSGASGAIVGAPQAFEDGSGHIVASISSNNLGAVGHRRRFIADYSPRTGAEAAYILSDTSTNGVFWQLCTHELNTITTAGNSFTVTGPDGATMKGTVIHPATADFIVGKRIRGSNFDIHDENNFVLAQSADGDYLVVLTVARAGQPHPVVQATGTWNGAAPNGRIIIGNFIADINGDAIVYPQIPRVTSLQRVGNDVQIKFATTAGKQFRVEWSTSPTGPVWNHLETGITGIDGELTRTDPGAGLQPSRFYRVVMY